MEMITAILRGSLELRVCSTDQTITTSEVINLDKKMISLMNRYGDSWYR